MMFFRHALLLFMVAAISDCRGQGPLEEASKALSNCDYGEACAKALGVVRSLSPKDSESKLGLQARSLALHVAIQAAAAFPEARDSFLKQIGYDMPDVATVLRMEAEKLAQGPNPVPGASDAAHIAAFLRNSICDFYEKLRSISKSGGPFADSAVLGIVGSITRTLASIEPERAGQAANILREMIGCTMSERVSSDALVLEARNIAQELAETCANSQDKVSASSCKAILELLSTRPLALPFPDASSGDLFGAMLPFDMRHLGLTLTPPWMIVLTAGRLFIVEQATLNPQDRQLPQPEPRQLMDLRRHHTTEDIATVFHEIFSTHAESPKKVVAFAVDRMVTAADFLDVLEGFLSESDSVPILAILEDGARAPSWLPINYRFPDRLLLDPEGTRLAFGPESEAIRLHLSPLEAHITHGKTERSVPVERTNVAATVAWDLRDVYSATLEIAGETQKSALLTVDPVVPVALLVAVIEVLSVRVPDTVRLSHQSFATAQPTRVRGGAISWLLRKIVVVKPD